MTRPLVLSTSQIEAIDERAVAWLAYCVIADGRGQKVSRFSDFLNGNLPDDLTMGQLLRLNPAAKLIIETITK